MNRLVIQLEQLLQGPMTASFIRFADRWIGNPYVQWVFVSLLVLFIFFLLSAVCLFSDNCTFASGDFAETVLSTLFGTSPE